jgi:hypothetical protein
MAGSHRHCGARAIGDHRGRLMIDGLGLAARGKS